MRISTRFAKLSFVLTVVVLFVVAGIGSGTQLASFAQAATPAGTTQAFAPCPANGAGGSTGSTTGSMSATMSATDSAAGGSTGSTTGSMSATMSATSSAGGATGTAYLGIQVSDVENCGVQILQVLPGSPAATANLMVGDVIVAVNGQAMSSMTAGGSMGSSSSSSSSATMSATGSAAGGSAGSTGPSANADMVTALVNLVQQHQAGDMLTLTIERSGQQMDIQVTLGTNPSGASGGASSAATPSESMPAATPAATAGQ